MIGEGHLRNRIEEIMSQRLGEDWTFTISRYDITRIVTVYVAVAQRDGVVAQGVFSLDQYGSLVDHEPVYQAGV
jgi:hypothetical protein